MTAIALFMLGWLLLSIPFGILVGKCIAHSERIEIRR